MSINYTLTTDHVLSCNGAPVFVGADGRVLGPLDVAASHFFGDYLTAADVVAIDLYNIEKPLVDVDLAKAFLRSSPNHGKDAALAVAAKMDDGSVFGGWGAEAIRKIWAD